ncbi:transposase [Gelidibacter maritimus]|uniref:Transposase n=1 Tax=Gelidibacter maritimus TaxID=2761487 RepID=A0A7W2M652_9FLAO|nr:transposase [Gelidibacter maritimus]MBA6153417.1 transposase [Gelidibacter maritimus]MBA6153420.1 transposase [Gelidibacter maritimus]MBA6153559.1 transposase [Gelidibacter maritimus]MBA6154797.1 transposase [Gelidibacter maritimus]
MKANIKLLKKQRIYSDEFKLQIVKDFESGEFSVTQLEKLHNISNVSIYKWIHKFSTFNEKGSRIVEMKNSSTQKMKEQQARIKELEAIVGRKQIKIDYLEKMIDIAKDDLNIDIKKNFSTPQSTGSGHIKKK